MRNEIGVLIVKDDKVFITKVNDEWTFPIFKELEEEKSFSDTNERIVLSFNSLIKDNCIHLWVKNNTNITGEFYSLTVEIKDFNTNNYQEYKWISLEDIDNTIWNEESKSLIDELKKYLSKQSFSIKIDTDKYKFRKRDEEVENEIASIVIKILNEAEGDLVWEDTCSLLEAERKFGEIIRERCYKLRVTKEITKWKTIRLYDENGEEIRIES